MVDFTEEPGIVDELKAQQLYYRAVLSTPPDLPFLRGGIHLFKLPLSKGRNTFDHPKRHKFNFIQVLL